MMRHVEIYLNVTLGHAFLRYSEGDETRCAWRGYLDLPEDDEQACHILWAYFQNPLGTMVESRQDQAWLEQARKITKGYEDRSLSAGDVVTLDKNSYAVETIGWRSVTLLTGQDIIGPEGDERLRQQVVDAEFRCPVCGGHDLALTDTSVHCNNALCGFSHVGDDVGVYVRGITDE